MTWLLIVVTVVATEPLRTSVTTRLVDNCYTAMDEVDPYRHAFPPRAIMFCAEVPR